MARDISGDAPDAVGGCHGAEAAEFAVDVHHIVQRAPAAQAAADRATDCSGEGDQAERLPVLAGHPIAVAPGHLQQEAAEVRAALFRETCECAYRSRARDGPGQDALDQAAHERPDRQLGRHSGGDSCGGADPGP
ncbi:hypothetical protein [Nocardia wallacei]|uniref:hypothetical protein n=1 Tax=Nocardia wallacei TaxID=480035 RepID=UPI002456B9C0|nr:hypothetical protein [Nocardia wallacei]